MIVKVRKKKWRSSRRKKWMMKSSGLQLMMALGMKILCFLGCFLVVGTRGEVLAAQPWAVSSIGTEDGATGQPLKSKALEDSTFDYTGARSDKARATGKVYEENSIWKIFAGLCILTGKSRECKSNPRKRTSPERIWTWKL